MVWIKENWQWIGLVLQVLFTWLIWSMRKEFATKGDLRALELRIAAAETELKLHKQTLDALPTDDDLQQIKSTVNEVHRQSSVTEEAVNGMSDQIKGLANQVGQLNNFLLQNSRPHV